MTATLPESNAAPACGCAHDCASAKPVDPVARTRNLRRALHLEVATLGWNVVEGAVAVGAALAAGSVALLGFGLDSFVECASAAVIVWRVRAEQRAEADEAHIEAIEHRARRLVAISLGVLAAWVTFDASKALWLREHASRSPVGIALTAVSIALMLFLARAKRRTAVALESRALEADAFQTTACFWLSVATLGGLALNAAFGWWWADPVAALVIASFIGREAREAWEGRDCCA
jgi:divalent metal cation (Fe/Co/Zn/Cd) transporter